MSRLLLLCLLFLLALPAAASAQATRTWVSHTGDDANPCSKTAPCSTWAGAISKTAAGGEIDALDPGGYGPLTITKSITVNGNVGGSTLNSGVNGFVVNMSLNPGDVPRRVVIRNLDINGAGTTLGTNGIRILDANSVHLEDVFIENQSAHGIDIAPSAGQDISVSLNRVSVTSVGGAALRIIGTTPTQKLDVIARDSSFRRAGTAVLADTGATAWLTGVTLFDNGTAIATPATNGAAGVVNSFCDIQLAGNTDDGIAPNRLCPDPPVQTNTVTNNTIVREPAPPAPAPTVVTKEATPVCVVPELVGLKLSAAKRGLKAAGCDVGAVKRKKSRRQAGRVLSQKAKPGSRLAAGTKVAVTVGRR